MCFSRWNSASKQSNLRSKYEREPREYEIISDSFAGPMILCSSLYVYGPQCSYMYIADTQYTVQCGVYYVQNSMLVWRGGYMMSVHVLKVNHPTIIQLLAHTIKQLPTGAWHYRFLFFFFPWEHFIMQTHAFFQVFCFCFFFPTSPSPMIRYKILPISCQNNLHWRPA